MMPSIHRTCGRLRDPNTFPVTAGAQERGASEEV